MLHTDRYPNVRIITTSRETQAAYYASTFRNIRVVGLKEKEILAHLEMCGIPQPVIGNVRACDSLMQCLRIPLYLCMFSAEQGQDYFLPETAGEILYCFFHKNSSFYNVRARMSEIRSSNLTEQQIAVVLDFVIPYIGWSFENKDTFFMNERMLQTLIGEAMQCIKTMFAGSETNPFPDFKYSGSLLRHFIVKMECWRRPPSWPVPMTISVLYTSIKSMKVPLRIGFDIHSATTIFGTTSPLCGM